MSLGPSKTPDMQENLPPELPLPTRQPRVRPVAVPMLPTRRRPPATGAPLPDPVAVRRIAIPDTAPPFDDEPQETAPRPEPGDPAASEPEPGDPTGGQPADSGSRPGERASPGPQAWPSQFAQVLAETLAGSRPATQLRPWTTEQTRQRIRQLGPMLATGQRPRVRRIMTSAPSPDVLEMTAVVGFGSRVRVLALRLERAEEACQHWRCTAIESA
jgi:hypothetical protein